jgi:acetolactate synthase-1/2/3 large subunit
VLIDMPTDLTRAEIDYQPVRDVRLPGYQPTTEGNQKQVRLAAKALANARRPVLYVGGGAVLGDASAEVTELATVDGLPVTCTLMGLGAFPAPHPQWLGMLGMHGTRTANYAMDEADLIVAIGARFDDRITGKLSEFAPRAKFVHIDIDPAEISKNVPAHIPIVGDVKNIVPALTAEYRSLSPDPTRLGGVVGAHPRLADAAPAALRGLDRHRDQAAVPRAGALRGDRTKAAASSHRHRPAPDVGGAVPSTSPMPRRAGSVGRSWGPWASACRPPYGRGGGAARPDDSVVLSGDASIQMNTSGAGRTLATTRSPSRSSIRTTATWAWSGQWQELSGTGRLLRGGTLSQWTRLRQAVRGRWAATGVRLTDKTTWSRTCARRLRSTGRS